MIITTSSKNLKKYEKLKVISQVIPIMEKMTLFQNKYRCSFEAFEEKVKGKERKGEQWNDYLKWKSYKESLIELEHKLGDLEKEFLKDAGER